MNKVVLMGHVVADPEVRYTQASNGESLCVARYRLGVSRPRRSANAQDETDFINCVAFNRAGEFAEKYLKKGMKIAVVGRIQTGSYTNRDGQKVYTTDVVVEEHEFAEKKQQGAPYQNAPAAQPSQGYQQGAPYQNAPQNYQNAPAQPQGMPYQNMPAQPPQGQGYQQGAPYQNMPAQAYPGAQAPNPSQASAFPGGPAQGDGFMNIPDGIDEELPFC